MTIKFTTKYDYFQAILGTISFLILISINRNIGTLILASIIFLFGIYTAFKSRIIFNEENITVRNLFIQKELDYNNVMKVIFSIHFHGKSFLTIFDDHNKYTGYLSESEWVDLRIWIENKGIQCFENR